MLGSDNEYRIESIMPKVNINVVAIVIKDVNDDTSVVITRKTKSYLLQ